jgi:fumarylacetoacetate (FAA) hydrolase
MKLASLRSGRDGQLIVVSRDLSRAIAVPDIAATLQDALDRWHEVFDALILISESINNDTLKQAFNFDVHRCAAPLPRAYQWADASAYLNHVELLRKARGAEMPESFWREPLIYQGGSDEFLAATDDIPFHNQDWGLDFEAEVAVITDDVSIGTRADEALEHIKLLMLVNDVSLRGLIPDEIAKGFGFFQSKPATSFSPVAVTTDELGLYWTDTKLQLPLHSYINDELFGKPHAGKDMTFNFAELIQHATKTRNLGSGTIIGSGTVSNKQGSGPGSSIASGGLGYSCIAELRMIETINSGAPTTPFLKVGDKVKIEMLDASGNNLFGSIKQTVVQASRP